MIIFNTIIYNTNCKCTRHVLEQWLLKLNTVYCIFTPKTKNKRKKHQYQQVSKMAVNTV